MIEFTIFALTALLCGLALLLSALAFSGTWMVLLAALITAFTLGFPNLGTLIVFALICIATEVFEALAGFLGVQKRGGSRLAGVAAIFGGLIGAVIGSAVFPIIGTVAGMLLGSFALAFFVEYQASGRQAEAAHIARGAVWARLGVMLLKTALTLGMSIWLLGTLLHN